MTTGDGATQTAKPKIAAMDRGKQHVWPASNQDVEELH